MPLASALASGVTPNNSCVDLSSEYGSYGVPSVVPAGADADDRDRPHLRRLGRVRRRVGLAERDHHQPVLLEPGRLTDPGHPLLEEGVGPRGCGSPLRGVLVGGHRRGCGIGRRRRRGIGRRRTLSRRTLAGCADVAQVRRDERVVRRRLGLLQILREAVERHVVGAAGTEVEQRVKVRERVVRHRVPAGLRLVGAVEVRVDAVRGPEIVLHVLHVRAPGQASGGELIGDRQHLYRVDAPGAGHDPILVRDGRRPVIGVRRAVLLRQRVRRLPADHRDVIGQAGGRQQRVLGEQLALRSKGLVEIRASATPRRTPRRTPGSPAR